MPKPDDKGSSIKGTKQDDEIVGTGKSDRIDGRKGDDIIAGGDGDDRIKGGPGDDVISGDDGNDRIKGGKGDDTLRGGDGDDRVDGKSGNDTLVYNAAANTGAHDVYDGGSGNDALLLELTRDEWLRPEVQADIARFLDWLERHDNRHGDGHHDDDGHGNHGHGDVFHFTAFDLDVRKVEDLRVIVDGVELDPRDEAVDAVDDAAATGENDVLAGSVLGNDDVPDLVKEVRLVSGVANGDLTLNADGTFSFDPGAAFDHLAVGESAVETFTYEVEDADGDTDQATVSITINGANDVPIQVAENRVADTNEDASAFDIDLLDAFGDPDVSDDLDSANVTLTSSDGRGVGFSVDNESGVLTLDPGQFNDLAVGQSAQLTLAYDVVDGNGGVLPTSLSFDVAGVNDAPVIGGGDADGAVTALPADAAPTPGPIVFTVEQYLGVASTDFNFLANYAATHAADYTVETGVIDFTDDPAGFAGELPGSNPWPAEAATGQSGTSSSVNNNFFARITTDFLVTDADTYTFRTFNDDGVRLLIDGNIVINDPGIHPEAPFEGSIALAPGSHSLELFFYEFGGEASLELSVRDSAGVYGLLGADGGGLGGAPLPLSDSGSLTFTDADLTDGHSVGFTPAGADYLGVFSAAVATPATGGATGEVEWTFSVDNAVLAALGADDVLTQTYAVTVDDGFGGTATQDVTVTITGVNDDPAAAGEAFSIDEDTALIASVAGNDTDVDGDTLTYALAAGPANGTLVLNADGTFTYTPDADFNGADSFTYTVSDGFGGTDTATADITVNPINDAPEIAGPVTGGNLVVNGSFEGPASNSYHVAGTASATTLAGWTVTLGDIDHLNGWEAADGLFSLDLHGFARGAIQQDVATVAGQLYAVEFALSKNPGTPSGTTTARVAADGTSQDFVFNTPNNGTNMQWQYELFTFTAADGSTALSFDGINPSSGAWGPALDDVSMVAVAFQTDEDTPVALSGISFADVDADEGAGLVQASLSVDHGTLTLADTLGLSAFAGNGTSSVSLTGSLAEVNEAINGILYAADANYNGLDSLDVAVSDLGNTGLGGVLADDASYAILIDAVNDLPVAGNDAFTFSGNAGPINISGASLLANDTDVDGDGLSIVSIGNASGGTVSLSGGNVIFTPDVFTGAVIPLFGDGRLVDGLGGTDGYGENAVSRNDDGNSGSIDVSGVFDDGLNFFGTTYNSLYINTNGNVTFGGSLGTFTPFGLTSPAANPIIAPYFADVDTRAGDPGTPTPGGTSTGSNLIHYDLDTVNGVFTATWDDVGYYSNHTAPLNAFQLQLFDRGNGDFDIVFRYEDINWTTGDASGGSGGLGGTVARAGWNSGNGADFFELGASGNQAAMLDLENAAGNLDTGVWLFEVRGGSVAGNDGFDYTISDGNGGFDVARVDLDLLF